MQKKQIQIKIKKSGQKGNLRKIAKDGPTMRDVKDKGLFSQRPKYSRIVEIKGEEERKKFFIKPFLIGFFFVILGVLGEVILGFYFWQEFFKSKDRLAKMVPQETVFYAHLDLGGLWKENTKAKKLISKFLPFENFEKVLGNWLDSQILRSYGLEFDVDIKPYLKNEIALAVVPRDKEKDKRLSSFLVIEISDSQKFNDNLSRIKGCQSQEDSYSNVQIFSYVCRNVNLNFSYAVLDNFYILSKNKGSIQQAIQARQNKSSLAFSKKYKKKYSKVSFRKPFVSLYFDASGVSKNTWGINEYLDKHFSLLPALGFVKQLENFIINVDLDKGGLNIKGFSTAAFQGHSLKFINFLPKDAVIAFLGYDLKKEWSDLVAFFEKEDPVLNLYLKNFEMLLKKEYQINLEEDIYPLFEKEYGVLILPSQQFGIVLELKNKEETENKMKKIEYAISHHYGLIYPREEKITLADGSEAIELFSDDESFLFEEIKFENVNMKSIVNSKAKNHYTYVFFDEKLIFGTSPEVVKTIISEKLDQQGLAKNSEFSKSLKQLHQSIGGLVYINFPKLFEMIGFSEQRKKYIAPIKNVILTLSNSRKGTAIEGFLLIE